MNKQVTKYPSINLILAIKLDLIVWLLIKFLQNI